MDKNAEVKKLPFVAARIDKLMEGEGSFKAYATVTIANSFMVHNVKVIDGSKGLFVAMPTRSYTDNNGETKYSDVCHSITADMKQRLDAVVLKAYEIATGQTQGATSDDIEEASVTDETESVDEPFEESGDEPVSDFGQSI